MFEALVPEKEKEERIKRQESRRGWKEQYSSSLGLFFVLFFFPVPQLYLWGSPLLGEIFAYVTVF